MKKLIKILSLLTLNSLLIANTVACSSDFWPNPGPDPKPDPNPQKDINYYLNEIKMLNEQINKHNQALKEWGSNENKKEICGSISECKDWKIGEISIKFELQGLEAQVQDYNYQILLLKYNHSLTPEAKKVAKRILKQELNYLNQELSYLKNDLIKKDTKNQVIATQKQIDKVNKILQNL